MVRYLIDVNLPYYFFRLRGAAYVHLKDFGAEWPDTQVWAYARQ
jgi:hypothetical protein